MLQSFLNVVYCSTMVCCLSCSNNNTADTYDGEIYTIEIRYEDSFNRKFRESWDQMVSEDSLYLFFEQGFKDDVITIYINGEKLYESNVTTDIQDGSAGQFESANIQNSKHLSLRLNNGPLVFFEQTEKKDKLLNLNYDRKNNHLLLSVINHVPFYD